MVKIRITGKKLELDAIEYKLKNKVGKRSVELVLLQSANICISVPFTSWIDIIPTLEKIQANLQP